MPINLTLEQIYSKKYLGYSYKRYADKLRISQLTLKMDKTKSQEIVNEELMALKELRKNYYLMSITMGNASCVTDLVRLYVKSGEYEKLNELFELTNYFDNNADKCNEFFMKCSIVNKDRTLIETHFDKIVNKTGDVYFAIGVYYKDIKENQLAIKNLKFASDNRIVMANHIIGTWYVYTKDKCNATKYFLKVFSYEDNHVAKIKALQHLIDLKNNVLVENMITKILSTCDAILASKKSTEYKCAKYAKYKNCCEFLKAHLCKIKNNFEEYQLVVTNLYNEMTNSNKKIKNENPEKLIARLNEILLKHKKHKKRSFLDVYVNLNVLIWFAYHKIKRNYYNLFLQHSMIEKRIDNWIKMSEKYYMSLEDKRLSK